MPQVATGLDQLIDNDFRSLRGKKVGLLTHSAAVDSKLRHIVDVMLDSGLDLRAIFGPEHGLHGQAQDLIGVTADESRSSTTVHSLYGSQESSLHPTREQFAELDVLVVDLQDIGSRYYTYQATMLYCLEVALPMGLPVIVLDRPNPINGVSVSGPSLKSGIQSFVGAWDIAIRHGMTMGELARFYVQEHKWDGSRLNVLECQGWQRGVDFSETGLPWVMPSPNMPTLDTAYVYPGQCLFEGTNLSEGRGTTRPFEICGATWIDSDKLAGEMNRQLLPGVVFRPVWFRPTFQKFAGQDCGGVQLHVTDRRVFRPIETSLALLIAFRNQSTENFRWRTEVYEFVEQPIAIDLLFGSSRERLAIEAGVPWQEIVETWRDEERAFEDRRQASLLY